MTKPQKSILDHFHIFGLASFALSLPIFITLAQSQEFFLVYRAPRWAIVTFALITGLALPLTLQLIIAAIRRINSRIDQPAQATAIAILTAIALMPNAKKIPLLPGWAILTLCVMLGTVIAHYYLKNATLRAFISLFSVAALFYPLWFISQSQIVFPPRVETQINPILRIDDSKPPIVVVVYDELSLQTLLNSDRLLDKQLFPNFARLANNANWFRNGTTVADMTTDAVPAIFTGKYTRPPFDAIPTYANFPENIFTLLDRYGYDIYAHEGMTSLCPLNINRLEVPTPSLKSELRTFATDILVITGHLLLKEDLAERIPPIEGMVARFAETAVSETPITQAFIAQGGDSREKSFNTMLQAIESARNRAYIIHLGVPHQPYRYMQSGNQYISSLDFILQPSFHGRTNVWDANPTHATRAQQRYFHQVQYCDHLLGRLLDKLESQNIYDQALIAVVADHGISFRPQLPMRRTVPNDIDIFSTFENALDIVKVPLILKLPNQETPAIIDEPFQTIDLLPTIIDSLELGPTDTFDGRPVLSPQRDALAKYRFFSRGTELFTEHNLDILDSRYDLDHKFENIERSPGFPIRSRYSHTLQQDTLDDFLSSQKSALTATLITSSGYQNFDPNTGLIPALVRAQIKNMVPEQTEFPILVNINNQFGAVATTFKDSNDRSWIAALVSESLFQTGLNTIQLYEIAEDENKTPRLLRIDLE